MLYTNNIYITNIIPLLIKYILYFNISLLKLIFVFNILDFDKFP